MYLIVTRYGLDNPRIVFHSCSERPVSILLFTKYAVSIILSLTHVGFTHSLKLRISSPGDFFNILRSFGIAEYFF